VFSQMKQQRPEQCISNLRFDALAADELDAGERHALEQHVMRCVRCHARERALSELRDRFDAQQPARVPADPIASGVRAKPRTWLAAVAVTVAVAAAALLALSPRGDGASAVAPTERTKGGEHIAFFLKRGDQVQRGARDQNVQPGDKLRFLYSAPRARYLAIVSLDSKHQVSIFYPASERAERVEPGVDVALPSAVELDGALGEERVYALFCDVPLELAALRAELGEQGAAFAAPAGCTMDALVLRRAVGSATRPFDQGRR
jgi:hypothetical protein